MPGLFSLRRASHDKPLAITQIFALGLAGVFWK
jgi:hypothetical protein